MTLPQRCPQKCGAPECATTCARSAELPVETRSCRLCNGEPIAPWPPVIGGGPTHHTCHPGEERATLERQYPGPLGDRTLLRAFRTAMGLECGALCVGTKPGCCYRNPARRDDFSLAEFVKSEEFRAATRSVAKSLRDYVYGVPGKDGA